MKNSENHATTEESRQLRRSVDDRKIAGVASGLAKHFNTDVTLVRVLFVGLSFFSGVGVALYLAAWALVADVGSDNSIAGDVVLHGWCH